MLAVSPAEYTANIHKRKDHKRKEEMPGGGDPSVLDANYPPQLIVGRRPLGGGGGGGGGH